MLLRCHDGLHYSEYRIGKRRGSKQSNAKKISRFAGRLAPTFGAKMEQTLSELAPLVRNSDHNPLI